jgi:hypothetical protein
MSKRGIQHCLWKKATIDLNNIDKCWTWNACKHKDGYGVLGSKEYHSTLAHRIAYELCNGPIGENLCVLHICDNGLKLGCINPTHLRLGTQTENIQDMDNKGRRRVGHQTGETNKASKLTETDVRAIRIDKRRHKIIARDYGISKNHVKRLKQKKRWGWLPD